MNLTQLHKQFGTQDKCISYLEKIRWNNTIIKGAIPKIEK